MESEITVGHVDHIQQPPHSHKNFTALGLLAHYLAGFLAFSVIYLLSYDIHWTYYKRERKRMNMFVYTVRFVRIVHASLATATAVPIMVLTSEFLKERFLILDMFVAISGGYLTFDVLGRYNEHLQVYEPPGVIISRRIVRRYVKKCWLPLLHHSLLIFLVYPLVLFARDDQGDFLVACILFTELCVPFTELQWLMEQTLVPHNLRYITISMIALSTQLVSRILIVPFLYEAIAEHMEISVLDMLLTTAPWWHIAAVAFLLPNSIWLAQNVFKTVVYLRIPYERKRKPKKGDKKEGEAPVKLEREVKILKED